VDTTESRPFIYIFYYSSSRATEKQINLFSYLANCQLPPSARIFHKSRHNYNFPKRRHAQFTVMPLWWSNNDKMSSLKIALVPIHNHIVEAKNHSVSWSVHVFWRYNTSEELWNLLPHRFAGCTCQIGIAHHKGLHINRTRNNNTERVEKPGFTIWSCG
jgi:hypothetical protein